MALEVPWLTIVVGSLSIIGSLALILAFLLLPDDTEAVSRKLIFFLSLADLGQSLFFLGFGFKTATIQCYAFAVMGIFFCLSSFFWTVAIAHYIWRTVAAAGTADAPPRFVWYHAGAWGGPVLMLLAVLWSNSFDFGIFGA